MTSSETSVSYKRDHTGELVASRSFVHVLHPPDCENSEKDIALMKLKLREDPECLERESDEYGHHLEYLKPLGQAINKGHEKCVEFLVNPGGDIKNYSKESIRKIVFHAIELEREGILEYFLTHKLYRSLAEPQLDTEYLHYVVQEERDLKIIDILVKHGVPVENFNNFDIELEEYSYTCPAAAAILMTHPDILKHLLLHGAVVDHRQTGRTDLSPEVKDCLSLIHHFVAIAACGITMGNIRMLTMLHEFGANLWERNRHGLTPVEVMQNVEFLEREVDARDQMYQSIYYDIGDEESLEEIREKMSELMVQPLKLASWCRVSLVRSMGVKYLENIDKLTPQDLPAHIKDFLRGDDLKTTCY